MVNLGTTKPQRHCTECGQPFTPKRHDQVFCSGGCRFEDHNRAMRRGREAYRAIYHWRMGQGKGQRGSLLGVVSRMGKQWVEEDRAAGRTPPPLPEELVTRKQQALYGYVRRSGEGYVRDPVSAARVLDELRGEGPKDDVEAVAVLLELREAKPEELRG